MIATALAAAAISVTPARLDLAGAEARVVTLTNAGDAGAVVDVRPGGLAVDARGRAAVASVAQEAAQWLRVRPRRLVLPPGGVGAVTVSARPSPGARPGDHPALVLLATEQSHAAGVGVLLRIGVVVVVRVAGRIVHRLELGGIRARRGALELGLANRGNVVERVRLRLALWRRGRLLARSSPRERILLPRSRGVARFAVPHGVHGRVVLRVELGALRRTLRLRL